MRHEINQNFITVNIGSSSIEPGPSIQAVFDLRLHR